MLVTGIGELGNFKTWHTVSTTLHKVIKLDHAQSALCTICFMHNMVSTTFHSIMLCAQSGCSSKNRYIHTTLSHSLSESGANLQPNPVFPNCICMCIAQQERASPTTLSCWRRLSQQGFWAVGEAAVSCSIANRISTSNNHYQHIYYILNELKLYISFHKEWERASWMTYVWGCVCSIWWAALTIFSTYM
jgi:hypothetical protein